MDLELWFVTERLNSLPTLLCVHADMLHIYWALLCFRKIYYVGILCYIFKYSTISF